MFSPGLFNRLIFSQKRAFCSAATASKKVSNLSFGDARMPDKLYKTINLEMRSYEKSVLKSYEDFIKEAASHLNVQIGRVTRSRKPTYHRFTVLKSVHVYRKHLVQYEIRTYYTWILLQRLTGSTADTFLEYIERMLPEGVALKVTKTEVEPLPSHLTAENIQKAPVEAPKSEELQQ